MTDFIARLQCHFRQVFSGLHERCCGTAYFLPRKILSLALRSPLDGVRM